MNYSVKMSIQKKILNTINKIDYKKINGFKKGKCLLASTQENNFTFLVILKEAGQSYLHREPPDVIISGKINLWKIENKTVPEGSVLLTLRYSKNFSNEQYYNIFLKEENNFKRIIESVKKIILKKFFKQVMH